MANLKGLHSGRLHDLKDIIEHSKKNKLSYRNLSKRLKYNDIELENPNSIFYKYKDLLIAESVETTLRARHENNPDRLSYDIYGCTELAPILLMINGVTHPSQFNKSKIKVISESSIDTINKIIERHKDEVRISVEKPIDISGLTLKPINL